MINLLLNGKYLFFYEYFFLLVFQLKAITTSNLCDEKSSFYGLYLDTSYNQDYENTNISIISDCSINKYWKVKTGKETNFHIHKILEDEKFNRRVMKFGYNLTKYHKTKQIPEKYKVKIKSYILEGSGYITFGSQTLEEVLFI